MSAPIAFVSHSSANKDIAKRLAEDLRKNGIDAWFDAWEIAPGESLRRKIEAGIEAAQYFIVLLTPESLRSEWVQTELDAALIKKIEGNCHLVPIIHGIGIADLTVILRTLKCVDLSNYDSGLKETIEVCLGLSKKPPLGNVPLVPVSESIGLSITAQKICAILCERSEVGLSHDPLFEFDEMMQITSFSSDALEDAYDELEETYIVGLLKSINGLPRVFPRNSLFWIFDHFVKGWSTKDDALSCATFMLNGGEEGIDFRELEKGLGWPLRRLNPATTYLAENGHVQAPKAMCHPHAYPHILVTPKTRRFVKNS